MQYYASSIHEDNILSIPHAATIVVVVGLNREGVEWAQSTDQTMRVLVCWKARRRPVTDWPYIRAFQMTAPEIIIIILSCLSNKGMLAYYM